MTIQIISLLIVGIIVFYFLRKEKVKNDTTLVDRENLPGRKNKFLNITQTFTNQFQTTKDFRILSVTDLR